MNKILLALACALASAQACAFEAIATVISVSPVSETVSRPTQRCWTEYQQQVVPRSHDYGGAIFGGITGGLLGSLMGAGNGKVAAAAAGAGLGVLAGDHLANRDSSDTYTVPVQRCDQSASSQTTTAYSVTYEYDGQRFMTRLPYNPGSQLRVNVSVTPK